MKETFEFSNNALWLRCEDTISSEPVLIISHYLFFRCVETDVEHINGLPAYRVTCGIYCARLNGQSLEFRLDRGGETRPGKFQRIPLAPPKTKYRTRWYNGQWQKLFKSGWKPA